jgi:glutathione S-transferase
MTSKIVWQRVAQIRTAFEGNAALMGWLAELEEALRDSTFLAGEVITIADLAAFVA